MSEVRFRPGSPKEAGSIHELVRAAEVHDREPLVTPLEEIVEVFEDPHLNAAHDVLLAELDGRLVAWGRVWHHPSGHNLERAYLFGTVHPEYRRRGIGTALLTRQLDRARSILEAYDHDLPRFVRTSAWDWLTDAQRLYERAGLQPVRWFDELLRPLDPALQVPAVPGVRVTSWLPDRSEEVRLLHNAAFSDHWGSGAIDPTSWEKGLTEYGSRLDLSVLAFDQDELVGYCLNEVYPEDEELLGRRDGWIGTLGVAREYRGRGIASALIAHSMERFRRTGLTHASLGVDADSPTGAHRLYERLGFRLEKRSVTHQVEVRGRSGE